MLTPDYLENVPAAMMRLWQQVEDDILQDVARRIGKMGEVTATADWQLWRREQTRLCNREVLKILAKYSGKSEAELRRIFQEAAAKALEDDDRLYTSAGLDPPAPNEDPALLNLLNAGYEQTAGTWQNLTATTAATVSQQFTAAADRAWLQVASGTFDYKTAVRRAVNGLAAHMAGVTYPTGHRDSLEVAVRRAVLTGVNQTAGKLQLSRMDEMDWQFVETSAHAGARPEHAKWHERRPRPVDETGSREWRSAPVFASERRLAPQKSAKRKREGRQFHRGGAVTYGGRHYPDFEKATGYGTGAGLCGWNCRHSFFAFDPDLSEPAYTEEELAALDAKDIEYRGKLYSRYEISQKQRALERKVRAAKRQYLAEDAAGLDTAQSAAGLKTARQNLAQFVRDTGGRNDSARTFVQGFGRSEASRATAQARQLHTPAADAIIEPSNRNGRNPDVNFVCKLDRKLYSVISDDIQTDEVIITEERIRHVQERHPDDYERFSSYLVDIIQRPDYIIRDERPNTGLVLKEIAVGDQEEHFRIALRLVTSKDPQHYKNSIITFLKIRQKEWERLIRNKEILYRAK